MKTAFQFLIPFLLIFSSCQDPVQVKSAAALEAYQAEEYDKAIELNKEVLGLDSSNVQTRYNLFVIYQLQNKEALALEELQQVLASNPEELIANTEIGLLYEKMGQAKEAIPHLNKAIALEGDNVATQMALSNSYQEVGEKQLAMAHANKVLELDIIPHQAAYNELVFEL